MIDCLGVVLAAGLGTRLRPATYSCPKPLIPVAGLEPLFFALWKAYQLGIRNFAVNSYHLPEQIEAAAVLFQKLLPESKIEVYLESPEILGSGGGLQNILRKYFSKHPMRQAGVLVQNGDSLSQIDLGALCADQNLSSIAVSSRRDHLEKYNSLFLDPQDKFLGVGKQYQNKGNKGVHFLGAYFLAASDFKRLISVMPTEICATDLYSAFFYPLKEWQRAPRAITFFEAEMRDSNNTFWFDMTDEAFLLEAQTKILEHLNHGSVWYDALKARYPRGALSGEDSFSSPAVKDSKLSLRHSVIIDERELGSATLPALDLKNASVVVRKESDGFFQNFPTELMNASLILGRKSRSSPPLTSWNNIVRVLGDLA